MAVVATIKYAQVASSIASLLAVCYCPCHRLSWRLPCRTMMPRPFRNATMPLMCAKDTTDDLRNDETTAGSANNIPSIPAAAFC